MSILDYVRVFTIILAAMGYSSEFSMLKMYFPFILVVNVNAEEVKLD